MQTAEHERIAITLAGYLTLEVQERTGSALASAFDATETCVRGGGELNELQKATLMSDFIGAFDGLDAKFEQIIGETLDLEATVAAVKAEGGDFQELGRRLAEEAGQ